MLSSVLLAVLLLSQVTAGAVLRRSSCADKEVEMRIRTFPKPESIPRAGCNRFWTKTGTNVM
jgi:hypothetical protein